MYYYIFEPTPQAKEYERVAQIKEYLSQLGIAGEMVSPIPGRTVEDLVDLAIAKRYSTLVVVGGSELINRVARALEPHDTVLGIVPLRPNPDLWYLLGTTDWKGAAEQLKRRRWQPVRLGLINEESCFLTPATVEVPKNQRYTIHTPTFSISGEGGTIRIAPWYREDSKDLLAVTITHPEVKGGLLSGLLKSKQEFPKNSSFIVPELTFHSEHPLPVDVAGGIISNTPIQCTTQARPLKLIVGKGTGMTQATT